MADDDIRRVTQPLSMSPSSEIIHRVLVEHTFVPGDDLVPGSCTGATCRWKGWFLEDWRRHVAKEIAKTLDREIAAALDGMCRDSIES